MTTTQRTQTMNDHDHIFHNLARTRGGQMVAITHCPPGELGERVADVKMRCAELINLIESGCPPGRWRSLAVRDVEAACMWAVKSITNEAPPPPLPHSQ